MSMTEDQRIRRRAERKAHRINKAALDAAGPLFEAQVELPTSAEAEYRKARLSWALNPRGHEAAYLAGIDHKWDLMVIRNLARQLMTADEFAIAKEREASFGSVFNFWQNILLGRRTMVIAWTRVSRGYKPCWRDPHCKACCEHGCSHCESVLLCYIEDVTLTEALTWPPLDYDPPMNEQQLKQYLALPMPMNFPGAIDPLGLGLDPSATPG